MTAERDALQKDAAAAEEKVTKLEADLSEARDAQTNTSELGAELKTARDRITTADVEAACRKANALDFIQMFPRKLETYCGERGVKLSGGQKQRLAIARAIIRKPNIVLLDEATSALDSKSEEVVQAALDQMIEDNASGCTIMIAHRLSTVKNCDTILALDKGHVVEKGTHSELLEIEIEKDGNGKTIRGLYRELWETQHGGVSVEQANKAREKEAAHVAEVARLTKEIEKLHKKLSADTKSERESIDLTRTPSEQSSMSDLDEGSEKEE